MVLQTHPSAGIRRAVYFAFSIAVAIGVFSYLFTQVSLDDVLNLFWQADLRGLLTFFALSLMMSVFRLLRYSLVLRVLGYTPNSWALFLVVLVRNLFADLLPARLGSLIYIYLTTYRLRVPFGPTASSFALALIFDIIAMVPLIALAVIWVGVETDIPKWLLLTGTLIVAAITVSLLITLPTFIRLGVNLVDHLPSISQRRRLALQNAMLDFERGINQANKSRIYVRLLFLSVLVRLCKYGALYIFLFALVFPIGFSLYELSVPKVFVGIVSAEFAASLPLSGIAGFGAYEGTWAFVFRLLGFSGDLADLTALTHHLFTQIYGYLLGALSLIVLMLPIYSDRAVVKPWALPLDDPVVFYARNTLLFIFIVAIAWLLIFFPTPTMS